jgi:predicted ATPase with chaperone activity
MGHEYKKWKSICEGFMRTRQAESVYERIRADRTDLRIKLKEATDKNKRQAVKTVEKVAAAREEAAQAHELELERVQKTFGEEFAKANNRWLEKNRHLQEQVELLKASLTTTKQ